MTITASTKLAEAKKLYLSAFPKEELLPWWVLRLMTLPKGAAITSYYTGDDFCGFTHTTITDEVVYVMFFAVQDELRGKGYGSAILEYLKQDNPGKPIILNVEPLDERADNAQQRISRMRFYEKNGFYDTGYEIDEVGGTFRILSTRKKLDVEAYLTMFQRMSFGLWRPEIREVQK
jgi:GNAT superfamily N-acetyltransferase